jgi:hypothetical protein
MLKVELVCAQPSERDQRAIDGRSLKPMSWQTKDPCISNFQNTININTITIKPPLRLHTLYNEPVHVPTGLPTLQSKHNTPIDTAKHKTVARSTAKDTHSSDLLLHIADAEES